ncbi:MAG: sodium/proline symporter [Clostridiales bacterium]|jgi:sodium/proline symporter|nr:sodium/proline symporter [Clostridiales bacterium]
MSLALNAGDQIWLLIAMAIYLAAIAVIGVVFAGVANKSSEHFFLGGRGLGPWVAAMSAEASDMSGWLLMGLPGVAYFTGLADAAWTAIGLAIGTYVNWLIVSKRLRRYSVVADNAITIPEFFSKRYRESGSFKPILLIASIIIIVFFSVYVGSCFVTCGKLFNALFGINYQFWMLIGALFVLFYTFMGGFLAESVTDFLQSIVMIVALVVVLAVGLAAAGGPAQVAENIRNFPGFTSLFAMANPVKDAADAQIVSGGVPQFGSAVDYGFLTIISTAAWGLGYFGMPQVLLRFMAIRKVSELKRSRRIAIIWCVIAMTAAVLIGLIGRAYMPGELTTASASENIFIMLCVGLFPSFIAGIVMSGILAAAMSSSDSYLLIAASAVARDIYKGIIKRDADDKRIMLISRVVLVLIAVIGVVIAWDENSVIFNVVSFAWAGFGAAFGPIMLFSLFWKRTTTPAAIAGILSGGAMVFIWNLLIKPLGGVFGIYELLPAFALSAVVIVAVSLLTPEPSKEIQADFDMALTAQIE